LKFQGSNFISQSIQSLLVLIICKGVIIGFGHGGISPSVLILNFVPWLGLHQSKNEQLFVFSIMKMGSLGDRDFHHPLPVEGVYRCLGVFMGVVNTVGWMEGVILIPK
jgi:hypothetical protein